MPRVEERLAPEEYARRFGTPEGLARPKPSEENAVKLTVDLDLHTKAAGDYIEVLGRVTNTSAITIAKVEIFAIQKNHQQQMHKMDHFYSNSDCLAPGQSDWVKGYIDTDIEEGLSFEAFPKAASMCPNLSTELTVTTKWTDDVMTGLTGEVFNPSPWPVKFAKVYANVFDPASGRLIGQYTAYAGDDTHRIQPKSSAEFKIFGVATEGRLDVTVRGGFVNVE